MPTGEPRDMVEVLRKHAAARPGEALFAFDAGGNGPDLVLTFGDLDHRARVVAAHLQAEGLGGERVLLLHPSGPGFIVSFFGALYAGAVPVPMASPRPAHMAAALPRIRAIARDARAAATLVPASSEAALRPLLSHEDIPRLLASGGPGAEGAGEWRPPTIRPESLAFLQYTSGSTGDPRGVMLTHANLLANIAAIRTAMRIHQGTRCVFWLPLHHDMGLIGGVLEVVFAGAQARFLSPFTFLKRPLAWLQAISQTRATISGAPNFAFEACLERIAEGGPAAIAELDLSSWEVAFCGSEPVRADTMRRFAAALAPAGLHAEALFPCYGLAESTLYVTGPAALIPPRILFASRERLECDRTVEPIPEGPGARALVSCGRCQDGHRVVIVDPERLVQLPDGGVGEIWVQGPSVAAGYFGRPEQTASTFAAHLPDTGEGPFLRTGDLGVLHQGELYVTGRIKELVIIRGRKHAPADLECTAASAHPALHPDGVAAFTVEAGGEEHLVLLCEQLPARAGAAPPPESEIAVAVRRAIAQHHEVWARDVVLVRRGGLPRTTSGKLQRVACRDRYAALGRAGVTTAGGAGAPP